ncbi:hypothetical protein LCGC14_0482150 [marine sediment metagenome]|uniref:Uncharacterized protein n=1 Tax=marine sediment metagenome TaxID=412755 RepID=A0A0F9SSA0_9ZZZZ|nr:MAG: hypothetical protein Lokiarch_27850 [Candidatus Lokiarchaeum sp. GC14_75]HEC39802.1 hypothetical protein [bacterium]
MALYKCPKCGREYKTKGAFYQKHVKNCVGEIPKQKDKKISKPQKGRKTLNTVIKRLESFDTRLSNLEKKFNEFDISNRKLPSNKSVALLPMNSEKKLVNIIKSIIAENANSYSIKGLITLKELRTKIINRYNLSEGKFEELMLKLYRKELVDLQAGGNPQNYQLKSPTGKEFYYLRVKEI